MTTQVDDRYTLRLYSYKSKADIYAMLASMPSGEPFRITIEHLVVEIEGEIEHEATRIYIDYDTCWEKKYQSALHDWAVAQAKAHDPHSKDRICHFRYDMDTDASFFGLDSFERID